MSSKRQRQRDKETGNKKGGEAVERQEQGMIPAYKPPQEKEEKSKGKRQRQQRQSNDNRGKAQTQTRTQTEPEQPAKRPEQKTQLAEPELKQRPQQPAENAASQQKTEPLHYVSVPQSTREPEFPEWAKSCFIKLTDISGDLSERLEEHSHVITDHEWRLHDIEDMLGIERKTPGVSVPTYVAPASGPKPAFEVEMEPAPAPEPEPEPVLEPVPEPELKDSDDVLLPFNPATEPGLQPSDRGYTGKDWVYFIHDKDGKELTKYPFYSCLAAKRYDHLYVAVPAWLVNGVFARELDPWESATPEFD